MADASEEIEIGAAHPEAVAERAVDTGRTNVEIDPVERAVVEFCIVAVMLEQEFAVEAGKPAELAIDTQIPPISLEVGAGIAVRLGPTIAPGKAYASPAKAIVDAALETVTLGFQAVVPEIKASIVRSCRGRKPRARLV